jgi:hypothetical protein
LVKSRKEAARMVRPKQKKGKIGRHEEEKLIGAIDEKRWMEYQAKVLTSIREDLLKGLKADEIFKKYEAHAAAALVSSLINPRDTVAAAEKILDRTQGKATQRTENVHKLEKLSDEELNALLKSQIQEEDETIQ